MKQCTFCYLTLDECNCPSEMTPVRQTGQQYYDALINANRRPKILTTGELRIVEHGHGVAYFPVEKEFRRSLDNDDEYIKLEMTYAIGVPNGTKLKVTVEVLPDENK